MIAVEGYRSDVIRSDVSAIPSPELFINLLSAHKCLLCCLSEQSLPIFGKGDVTSCLTFPGTISLLVLFPGHLDPWVLPVL